jgi:hypothetical protein
MKEHISAIKYDKSASTYAQHTLNTGHPYENITEHSGNNTNNPKRQTYEQP